MNTSMEGKQIPEVKFRTRVDGQWKDITTGELFSNKKVVAFALPGAFTPTCSSSHVPRYNELAAAFKSAGIDSVVCFSVNDAFVMSEWAANQHADNIIFVPDGNGEFSAGMNMLVDKRDLGFGQRSWRYSMYVENGIIKKMFVEADVAGDPFDVSDADTMLKYLNPNVVPPHDVLIFTKPGCSFCTKAKSLLNEHGWAYEEVASSPRRLRAVSSSATTPQIFIDGKYVGGTQELEAFITATPTV